jgi:hypothetical protein
MNLRFIGGLGNSAKIPEGGRELWEVWGAGPTSYVNTGTAATSGDPVSGPAQGEHLSAPSGSILTQSGNYELKPQPLATNTLRPGWVFRWFNVTGSSTGSGVVGATITAGGTYTGTTPSVTFAAAPAGGTTATGVAVLNGAGTAVIGILITNPGAGYLTAPAITIGAGGATATALLGAAGSTAGAEVAQGTNLSAEVVQFMAAGGQM